MITVTYDGDLGENVWAEFEVTYYVEKGYRDFWEGLPYVVPTQIYIEKVKCLNVEGFDSKGSRTFSKRREDLHGWEIDLDSLCHNLMDGLVEAGGQTYEFLLEYADEY